MSGTLYTPSLTNVEILNDQRYMWPRLCLDNRIWEQPTRLLHNHSLQWQECSFDRSNKVHVPDRQGIYMFVLKSNNSIFANNNHSYILYVGQTVNLKQRFSKYFSYKNSDKPSDQLKRIMVLVWEGKLTFNFFETTNFTGAQLDDIEFDLIDMIVPPMNNNFRAEGIKQLVKFYSPR